MKTFLGTLCILFSIHAVAQQSLTGSVADENNKPVANATITMVCSHQKNISVKTNNDGVFNFPVAIVSGDCKLLIEYVGKTSKALSLNPSLNHIQVVLENDDAQRHE